MIGYSHTVFSIDASISILYIPSHVLFLQCDTDRIYQEVGSVFPSSQPHQAFVIAAANRMCHRWHCVICTAGHKRQYGFCLALLLSFQPWNQDSTLWGSLSFMEKPHKTVPSDIPSWALADYQHPPIWEQTNLHVIPAFNYSAEGPEMDMEQR